MTRFLQAAGLIVLCTLLGCGSDKPPTKEETLNTSPPANPKPVVKNNVAKPVAPPTDAQWTIYCYEVAGPGHVDQINQLKTQLEQVSSMNGWHAIHADDKSSLYFGYYKDRNTPQLINDRKKIIALRDDRGDAVFANAVPVPLDAPDPASPPEWNLANSNGYWSIQVAAFSADPRRKEAAVELVRDWRNQGIEAYYFHGESVSSVCVGSYPEEALKKQDTDKGEVIDPTQPMMVINGDLPESLRRQFQTNLKDRDGNPVRVFVQKVEVVDPKMLEAFRLFPVHRYNYNEEFVQYRDPQTGQMKQYPKPCVIVPIPRKEAPATVQPGQAGTRPDLLAPRGNQQQGGRLRRIGE
jgi:hypothetical protein